MHGAVAEVGDNLDPLLLGQELYLGGRKAEAAEAVPDEYIDEGGLVGPPQRIRERFADWADSGATGLTVAASSDEGIELLAELAAESA